MLRRTYDETMKQVEGSLGKVEARALEFSDAGAYGDVPFIELRWIYRVNDGKEAHVGALKQSIIEKFGHDIYCAHLDLGYVKTFDDITRALAESFVAPPATPAPYYLEISTVSVGGRKLGLGITRLQRDEDGDTKATIMGAMVQATPDGKLRSRDSLDLSWVHPDGSLINAAYTASQDGAVVGDATLKPVDDVWVIAGEANGKKLDAKLAAGVQPDTWIEQALGVRKLLASPEAIGVETVSSLWTSNDLTRLTDEKLKVTAKKSAEEYTAHIDLGPLSAEAVIDAKLGVPKAADFPVGSETMHLERVYQSGNF
jgi:hypothetical protein